MKSRAGGFALIAALITVAIIAILKVMGGRDGKSADQAAIQAGDRAVAGMLPSCPEAPESCHDARFAALTAYALRKQGLQPGACMVCREENGVRIASYRSLGGDYEWRQGPDGAITAARPAGDAPAAPGLPQIPQPPAGGAGGGE